MRPLRHATAGTEAAALRGRVNELLAHHSYPHLLAMLATATKPKVAYLVTCDEACEIVYATNSATARREGANALGLDFADVEWCRRGPYLDDYAGSFAPAKLLIEEHHWYFACGKCFDRVNEDTEERVYDAGGNPYCSPDCLAAAQAMAAAIERTRAELTAAAGARWPGTTICWLNHDNRTVFLRFPGGQAGVTWHQGEDTVWCQPSDATAWLAYKATRQPTSPTP